eukprot:6213527-Prymnesium_polylepis.1
MGVTDCTQTSYSPWSCPKPHTHRGTLGTLGGCLGQATGGGARPAYGLWPMVRHTAVCGEAPDVWERFLHLCDDLQ